MSTRALISIEQDGKYTTIYNHFDGYPDGLGNILLERYNTRELAEKLIAGGDISTIGHRGTPELPNYYAQRGEWDKHGGGDEPWDEVKPTIYSDFNSLKEDFTDGWVVYLYVFHEVNEEWKWTAYDGNMVEVELPAEYEGEEEE